jgi:hypothetical protein
MTFKALVRPGPGFLVGFLVGLLVIGIGVLTLHADMSQAVMVPAAEEAVPGFSLFSRLTTSHTAPCTTVVLLGVLKRTMRVQSCSSGHPQSSDLLLVALSTRALGAPPSREAWSI